jgi:hypothetical protein
MAGHSHRFVESYAGAVAFGLDRQTDEATVAWTLQKLSDDAVIEALLPRLADDELRDLFDRASLLLRTHLSEAEYHELFLKD